MTSPKHQQVDFLKEIKVLTGMQDLSARHLAAVPEDIPTKKDSARDLELIFTKISVAAAQSVTTRLAQPSIEPEVGAVIADSAKTRLISATQPTPSISGLSRS